MGRRKYMDGAIVHEFFSEWPCGDDWYVEEESAGLLDEHGEVIAEPDKKYLADDLGVLCWQGHGDVPSHAPFNGEERLAVDLYIAWWQKQKSTATFSVVVPKEKVDEIRLILKTMGCKVSG